MHYVSMFEEGRAEQKDLLGGKGANLAEMTRMGLPVPPGFTITTAACRAYLEGDERLPDGLMDEVRAAVARIEAEQGRRFGDPSEPLLFSVRSGAKFSMPGMMDTVLNLGLNPETVKGLAELTGDDRFAYDAYRRFIEMFGRIVLGVPAERFDAVRDEIVQSAGVTDASELDAGGAEELAGRCAAVIEAETGALFPFSPEEQLRDAVEAVFRSWNGRRARDYRRMEGIPDDLGTAVNVQTMVFGNAGVDSGTGVAFTRDPSTGENVPYGDFLVNAQGEDVVAGVRHTEHLDALGTHFPDLHEQLLESMDRLEERYRDMCDIEFTIEHGRLYLLQTRVGKRTAQAAVRMAVDMVADGLIDEREAVLRFSPEQLERLLHPRFDPSASFDVLTTGLNASPGAASGHVYLTADDAEARAADGTPVILVRTETSPEDLHGMIAAQGILTSHGGLVSHAAVVARGIGKPAVCGASAVAVDTGARCFRVGDAVVNEGDVISIDGTTGEVVVGEVPVITPEPTAELETVLGWADQFRRLGVRANADTGPDARRAREFGAEGIGLCRTEHMFLGDRLPVVQEMILAETEEEERAALTHLHDAQLEDFRDLLAEMDGLPVTVRLLDPPLHEFLPHVEELLVAEARGELDEAGHDLLKAARYWQEDNPMLGTRGVRLGILKPHIYQMQVRALMEAAVERKRAGGTPVIEIMIPLTVSGPELERAVSDARAAVDETLAAAGEEIDVAIGTMIETPRAALVAGELAAHASFFSFGTNDLTQMTFGFSRDDVEGRLMAQYLEQGLLDAEPFETIDRDGVGQLIRWAVERGREAKPSLHTGICGEHGGEPASIAFCHEVGLDYVSCSPFRVGVARLAAAHAALADETFRDK